MGTNNSVDKKDFEETSVDLLYSAQEEIDTAKLLLEKGRYRASASRSYYAAFWAVESCLNLEHKQFSSHEQSIGNFNRDFIHSGILKGPEARGLHKKLIDCQSIRKMGDYEFYSKPFSKEDAVKQFELAKDIVECIILNYEELCVNKVVKENAAKEDAKVEKVQEEKRKIDLIPKPSVKLLRIISEISKETGIKYKGKNLFDARKYVSDNGKNYLEKHPEMKEAFTSEMKR